MSNQYGDNGLKIKILLHDAAVIVEKKIANGTIKNLNKFKQYFTFKKPFKNSFNLY